MTVICNKTRKNILLLITMQNVFILTKYMQIWEASLTIMRNNFIHQNCICLKFSIESPSQEKFSPLAHFKEIENVETSNFCHSLCIWKDRSWWFLSGSLVWGTVVEWWVSVTLVISRWGEITQNERFIDVMLTFWKVNLHLNTSNQSHYKIYLERLEEGKKFMQTHVLWIKNGISLTFWVLMKPSWKTVP